ncbi:hypothetical protein [Microbulbifer discodermiae]|uniref:hypothetical protein n=1 Tax=Microbulbifer sp. 2201CG32-9 TaxID=3232309 RepID=UPI00345BBF5A
MFILAGSIQGIQDILEGINVRRIKSNLLFFVLFLLLVVGCNQVVASGKAITEFGEYALNDRLQLQVENVSGIVKYHLVNNSGETLIVSKDRASVYQRWVIVWDGDRLWFSSSDIGGVVWIKEKDGSYSSTEYYKNSVLQKEIPQAIKEFEG